MLNIHLCPPSKPKVMHFETCVYLKPRKLRSEALCPINVPESGYNIQTRLIAGEMLYCGSRYSCMYAPWYVYVYQTNVDLGTR